MKYKNKKWGKFKSNLEVMAARLLDEAGLEYEYEPWVIKVVKPSKWNGVSYESVGKKKAFKQVNLIRKVDYTPDFVGKNWVMETKGMQTQDFIIRWKLFKRYLEEEGLDYTLFMPTNKKQIEESIKIIKELNNGREENQTKSNSKSY